MDEWKQKRSVRITASRFGDILARPSSKRYRYYMEDMIDSLNGNEKIPKITPWFDHGREMEDEAIGYYEWELDTSVERFGCDNPKLFIHPKYDFIGCSPDCKDGLGGAEFKCHVSFIEFEKARLSGIPSKVIPQVQGTLWILDAPWWNYVSYYRNEDKRLIHIHRVGPDLKYQQKLEKACLSFWKEIQRKIN